ncbi:FecR family protein [Solitalea sp. MAHUQ-68]|uniref:FecR family protein n=1 Tax=Solitalea agri TaxID=2953739 RepID=A0A9X2F1C5_9SPHI|nr:FecR family protein [Solitalea agri]MCO4292842.1 FecR family protein [Solitalea agri]
MTENPNKLQQKDPIKKPSGKFYPSTVEEQKQLDEWFESLPGNDSGAPFEDENEKKVIRQHVLNSVFSRIAENDQEAEGTPVRTLKWTWLKVAASVAAVTTIGWMGYSYWAKPHPIEYLTVTAQGGKVMQVTLPDNTTIWMQSGSTLKYPKQFSDTTREIYLEEGLAYFKVTHNAEKPFIVHTPKLDTRVLGTSFVIKAYQQMEDVEVELITGKVRVSHDQQILGELAPNMRLTYHKASAKAEIEELNTETSASFVNGVIVLQRAGFDELFATLQSLYSVHFNYDKALLKDCRFNLRFNTNLKVEQVLEIVNGIHPIKYDVKGKEITIKTESCDR